MILALLAAAQAVVVADHSGEPVGDELVWTSIYHLEPGERCVALAVDTPLGAEVCADRDRQPLLVVQSRQPFPDDAIRPPLAVGPVQRVHVKKAVLLPEGLDKGTLSYASPGVGRSLRRQVDRDLMGRRIGVRGGGLYVDPAQVGRGGIPGRVGRKAASEAVTIGVGLVLLGVLALMWAGHRLLDRLARRERNARWLADAAVEEELTWDGIR